MNKAAFWAIRFLSLFFRTLGPRTCRFHPTCSVYSGQAFRRFGFFKALSLSARRLLRCQPFSSGGYDPLPRSTV